MGGKDFTAVFTSPRFTVIVQQFDSQRLLLVFIMGSTQLVIHERQVQVYYFSLGKTLHIWGAFQCTFLKLYTSVNLLFKAYN